MFSDLESLSYEAYEFLTFASPEHRCLYSLNSICGIAELKRTWIGTFEDYGRDPLSKLDGHDDSAIEQYHENLAILEQRVNEHCSSVNKLEFRLNVLEPLDEYFGAPNPFRYPLLVDISCAPRGHLLALLNYLARCQLADLQEVALAYSLVREQAASEEAYSYGMQDVAVIPGFYGQMRLKHDLLIIALGFEGNRAFSLYRRMAPNKTFLILGDTGDNERSFYMERSKMNNHALINIHGNQLMEMPSRDPFEFATHFGKFLRNKIEPLSEAFNIYFSCLGTKLQALGAFLALQNHPYIQVVDGLPTRRRIASEGERETRFVDFGQRGLVDSTLIGT